MSAAIIHTGLEVIGALVCLAIALCGLLALVLVVWRWFPARFDVHLKTPSQLKTPYGLFNLDAWIGISGRRNLGWFVGFIYLSPGVAPRIITPKPDSPLGSEP